jgi:hypothetical protein
MLLRRFIQMIEQPHVFRSVGFCFSGPTSFDVAITRRIADTLSPMEPVAVPCRDSSRHAHNSGDLPQGLITQTRVTGISTLAAAPASI